MFSWRQQESHDEPEEMYPAGEETDQAASDEATNDEDGTGAE